MQQFTLALRRLKSEVLGQLAPKTERVERLEMIPSQQAAYDECVESYKQRRAAAKNGTLAGKQMEHVFTELRKVAVHPFNAAVHPFM